MNKHVAEVEVEVELSSGLLRLRSRVGLGSLSFGECFQLILEHFNTWIHCCSFIHDDRHLDGYLLGCAVSNLSADGRVQ